MEDNILITFKKIRAKNFLSIGNHWMEFDLEGSPATLIIGHNGAGKSSLLDMLLYVLFGKPYRDIKLGQLINTVNNKASVVEIEFDVLGAEYKIIRGQKPGIFEIYKDSELITQDAATKDYQKFLEKQILRMNHRSFKQLIIMGTAAYTPFMQLKAADRRQVIEDILDIAIYSKMGDLSRAKERSLKSDLQRTEQDLTIRRESLESYRRNLEVLKADKAKMDSERDSALSKLNLDLSENRETLSSIISKIPALKESTAEFEKLSDAVYKISSNISSLTSTLTNTTAQIKKIQEGTHCPTCTQAIPESKISGAVNDLNDSISDLPEKIRELESIRDGLKNRLTSLDQDVKMLNELNSQAREIGAVIQNILSQIDGLENSDSKFEAISSFQDEILKLGDVIFNLQKTSAEIGIEIQYYQVTSAMLKDGGVKSTIIAKYLPLINKLINQYLEMFGLFVGFELSPTFEETIKARHRDTYSYNSFSEGEKAKIDCSILFTWRHVAAMKNTVSCNILILDEIGGSSLDEESYSLMVEHLSKVAPNIFLITHRTVEEEVFGRVWEFSKSKHFSQYSERKN